jgi:serine/threonine-protein kinase
MAAWNPRANEIFTAALEVPCANRQAFLEQTCGADSELRRQVEAMLSAHAQAGSFLDQPVAGEPLTTAEVAPSSGPPLPATGSVVQALAGPAVDLPRRYQMEEEIARGGMGAVLRGRDTELKREIAVKVLLETHAGCTEFVQRFVEEAQIAGQLQHPGVAPVYDVGTAMGKRPYFTMKLVKGQTLAALLGARGDKRPACRPVAGQQPTSEPLVATDRPRFLKIFEVVCQTLAYAHAHDVIHRDLKPANVMVGAFGEVQVMDWGLAKVLTSRDREGAEKDAGTIIATTRSDAADSGHTQTGTAMGTPAYMSPEQARGEVECIDERADVFGLGALLCEILTGQPPFPGKSSEAMRKAKKGELADAFTRLDGCAADGELIALAKRCLAAEPEGRPRHAGAVAECMTLYLESVETRLRQAELERAQAQVRVAEERKRRRLTLALAASVLVTVLSAGGGYAWLEHQRALQQAATARKVDEALEQAAVLRGRAAAAGKNLSLWAEAQAEVRRAEDLLAQGEADETLRRRVEVVQAEVQRGREETEQRARDAAAERQLLARLETIRGEFSEHLNAERTELAYGEAFRVFGLDIDVLEPNEAGARLKARPGIADIAAGLDEWWTTRRRLAMAGQQDHRKWKHVLKVARNADPDPWRNRLRALIGSLPNQTIAALRKHADDTAALERQPAASLCLLARLLENAGELERSRAVLRAGWRRFPGDYWINHQMARCSWVRGTFFRPEEAVRFLTAAVAARPGSARTIGCLGDALHDQGKLDEAIACFRQAIALDPKLVPAHNDLGRSLCAQGKLDEAIASYHQAIRLEPANARAHYGLGCVLSTQGKWDEASESHRQAVALAPTWVYAHHDLGAVLRKLGKLDEAIGCYGEALKFDPKYVEAHRSLGIALREQGKLDEAIVCFRQAIEIDPKNSKVHNSLGRALFEQGKVKEAIASYRQAIALDPKYALAHNNLGGALNQQGKADEAIAYYRQAIQLDPREASAHHNLGTALAARGNVAEAIASYRQAIKFDPKNAVTHENLGNALYRQGKLDEAIASLRQALKLDPKDAGSVNNLGNALARQDKVDEAIASYRQAIKLAPKDPLAHNNLGGLLCDRKQDYRGAIDAFRQAISLDPKRAGAHCNLGSAFLALNELDEAVSSYRQAIRLDPKYAKAYHGLGSALSKQGKVEEAIANYRQAIQLDPKDARGRYILGNALFNLDRLDEASACLRQAIRLDPKLAEAHHTFGRILLEQRKVDEAIASFHRAIELDPKGAHVFSDMSVALSRQGKVDDAIAACRRAIQLDPKLAKAYLNLGSALCDHKRDYDGAAAAFRQAIQLEPGNARAHYNLGNALRGKGALDEAIAAYRQAIKLDPKLVHAHSGLGLALTDRGLLDEAIAACKKVLELDPKHGRGHRNLGWAFYRKGKLDDAIACYRQAIKLDAKDAQAYTNLGLALRDLGLLDDAIVSFKKVIELDSKNVWAHRNLGWLLQRKGKIDEAIACYRQAIKLDPKDAWTHNSLADLERVIAVQAKLPAFLNGDYRPQNNDERIGLARMCKDRQRYRSAAILYAEAFGADAKMADDLNAGHRYNAACYAALTAAGKGADKLDDKQRVRWRRHALTWLRADLALYRKQTADGTAAGQLLVAEKLRHWQTDPDLAGLRDKAAQAKLPAEERRACEKLWADVAGLLRQAQVKPAAK